jgi:uncharacterized protein (TIGR03437 family)
VTGFSIDGVAQPLAIYFPQPAITGGGTLNASVVLYNLQAPIQKKFSITLTDSAGNNFLREFSIEFLPLGSVSDFLLTAAPLTTVQDPTAVSSCQWPVQLIVTDIGGNGPSILTTLQVGGIDQSAQIASIFGTTRLNPYAALQGTLCFGGIAAPANIPIMVAVKSGTSNEITISLQPAPATPVKLSATPASLSLTAPDSTTPAQTTLSLDISDKTQSWNISISPNNRTTSWLTISQQSGTGPAQITVTANGSALEPAVYGATLLVQSANSSQALTVPVMFVLGGGISSIVGVANPFTHKATVSPGQLLEVYGQSIANSAGSLSLVGDALPQVADGVSATVNGYPANLLYISPAQIDLQVPYEAGAGPAVLGINNHGMIAGFPVQIVPAAPGIATDGAGNVSPAASVALGGTTTLYFTGVGDVSPQIPSGFAPSSSSPPSTWPVPLLPVAVTVGEVPALIQFLGIPPGLVGVVQLNFIVPGSVPLGTSAVVVTVNGQASPAANIKVVAASK